VQLYGRLHSDILNGSQYLLPDVGLQIKFTKAKQRFFLMNAKADAKYAFMYLDAQLLVNRIRTNPPILLSQIPFSAKAALRDIIWRESNSRLPRFLQDRNLSIDNALLGPIPKRLLFTIVKNTDFLGSMDTNPYLYRHCYLTNFTMYVNGEQFPNEGLILGMDHEITSFIDIGPSLRDRAFIHICI
jgi:hypothetical protein